jgi:hypothetical protein
MWFDFYFVVTNCFTSCQRDIERCCVAEDENCNYGLSSTMNIYKIRIIRHGIQYCQAILTGLVLVPAGWHQWQGGHQPGVSGLMRLLEGWYSA